MGRGVPMKASVENTTGYDKYSSGLVDYVKHEGSAETFEKCRTVIQTFVDEQDFLTHAPTISRALQLPLLCTTLALETLQFNTGAVN